MNRHKLWTGRRVKNVQTGEIFIETLDCDWSHRLSTWKSYQWKSDNSCPCPMPSGHVMFLNYNHSAYYQPVESRYTVYNQPTYAD